MKRYTIYFKNNKAASASINAEVMTHEVVKISNGQLEWLIIHAYDETGAIQLSNDIADDYLQNCLYNN